MNQIGFRSLMLGVTLGAGAVFLPDNGSLDPGARATRVTPIVEVVRKVGPTVVNLYSNVEYREFFGLRSEAASLGAGVIVHPSGIVVTNAHVLTANLDRMRIREVRVSYRPHWSGPNSEVVRQYRADVLGFNRENDLALVKIDAEGPFPAADLGISSDLMVGENVVAVGNPFGREGSVTHGIISATNRQLAGPMGDEFNDLIQTDASLNAGNSGGPLFNILGELIGINQAIGTDSRLGRAEGQGLAIPVDRVRTLLQNQFSLYELQHSYIGMTLKEDAGLGVRVEGIDADGPASDAGLLLGDRIVKVDEYPVTDQVSFNLSLFSASDDGASLGVERGDRTMAVRLKPVGIDQTVEERLGVVLLKKPYEIAPQIAEVIPRGPAADIGVGRGDIILKLGDKKIRSAQDLFEAVVGKEPGDVLDIVIRRYSRTRYEDMEGRIKL